MAHVVGCTDIPLQQWPAGPSLFGDEETNRPARNVIIVSFFDAMRRPSHVSPCTIQGILRTAERSSGGYESPSHASGGPNHGICDACHGRRPDPAGIKYP